MLEKPNLHVESVEYNLCYLTYTKVKNFNRTKVVLTKTLGVVPLPMLFFITSGLSYITTQGGIATQPSPKYLYALEICLSNIIKDRFPTNRISFDQYHVCRDYPNTFFVLLNDIAR